METYLEEKNVIEATDFLTRHNDLCVFDVLGLTVDIHDKSVIIKRWKQLSLMLHPDKNPHAKADVSYSGVSNIKVGAYNK